MSTTSKFEICSSKGRELFDSLELKLRHGPHCDATVNFDERYKTDKQPDAKLGLNRDLEEALEAAGMPASDDWIRVRAWNKGKPYNRKEIPYTNLFQKSGKSIACLDNDSTRDKPSERLYFQNVLYNCFRQVIDQDKTVANLEVVWRVTILNPATREIIKGLLQGSRAPYIDFEAGTEEFFALLGTDNGKSVVRMLQEYPVAFQLKTFAKVRILAFDDELFMAWFLKKSSYKPKKAQQRREIKSAP